MERAIEKELVKWKDEQDRLPLIVRGARQVGKSYTIESFGKKYFSNVVVINFEQKPVFASCFDTLEIPIILRNLSHLIGQEIIPGLTLLFLDEIQNCPSALKALRYFKENASSLHVIAAGSFLEFVLEDEPGISFPVGRVQFINMRPLSFVEYLGAIGQSGLVEMIADSSLQKPFHPDLHAHALQFVRDFFFVGGMPRIVEKFRESNSFLECQRLQASVLDLYRLDLAKYSNKIQYKHLNVLFSRLPEMVGRHFKYSEIDPESANPARDYKQALHKLSLARLVHLVHASSGNGPPLFAEVNKKTFKVFFLDLGLLQYALEVDANDKALMLIDIHRGVLAEQFVAQELLAYVDPYLDRHLFYWQRENQTGTAEVDFLANISGKIIPIEVKAGKAGALKSLKVFLEIKGVKIGVKISEAPLAFKHQVLSVPFYMIHQLPQLVQEAIHKQPQN